MRGVPVQEILDRVARENGETPVSLGGESEYWPARAEREQENIMERNFDGLVSYKPNRKIVAASVAGVVAVIAAYVSQTQGYELDEAGTTAVTALLMALVGYFVPESNS